LFTADDIALDGSMVKFAGSDWGEDLAWHHTEVSAYLVYFFVGLRGVAIAFYAPRGRSLVTPMVTRDVPVDAGVPSGNDF
jgi:hypothetical protein